MDFFIAYPCESAQRACCGTPYIGTSTSQRSHTFTASAMSLLEFTVSEQKAPGNPHDPSPWDVLLCSSPSLLYGNSLDFAFVTRVAMQLFGDHASQQAGFTELRQQISDRATS